MARNYRASSPGRCQTRWEAECWVNVGWVAPTDLRDVLWKPRQGSARQQLLDALVRNPKEVGRVAAADAHLCWRAGGAWALPVAPAKWGSKCSARTQRSTAPTGHDPNVGWKLGAATSQK